MIATSICSQIPGGPPGGFLKSVEGRFVAHALLRMPGSIGGFLRSSMNKSIAANSQQTDYNQAWPDLDEGSLVDWPRGKKRCEEHRSYSCLPLTTSTPSSLLGPRLKLETKQEEPWLLSPDPQNNKIWRIANAMCTGFVL